MEDEPLTAETRAALESAACGLLQTSAKGTFQRVNGRFCDWVGYAPEELIGQRRFQDLLTVGAKMFHQTHFSPLLKMQGSISEVKLELVHRDGNVLPMVINALRQEVRGLEVHQIACFVARDRDKYEQELVRSRRRLEELVAETKRLHAEARDRALFAEQMIGIVSHDLRNPLSGIAMGAALLERGELSASQQRNVSRIGRMTDRAKRLIADLLDFTQARLGKGLSVDPEPIALHQAIEECVEELAPIYPGRALMHITAGQGEVVGDRHRLAQLVGNLVSNAMTYGANDRPVTVSSEIEDTTFVITVHNDGPVIPEATREHLFEPMTRGTNAHSTGRSVGLGLYIVRQIALAHGGSVQVKSSAEEGTDFQARFPRGALKLPR